MNCRLHFEFGNIIKEFQLTHFHRRMIVSDTKCQFENNKKIN
jgi:hypothetical protein